jgi:hypothetical protein
MEAPKYSPKNRTGHGEQCVVMVTLDFTWVNMETERLHGFALKNDDIRWRDEKESSA